MPADHGRLRVDRPNRRRARRHAHRAARPRGAADGRLVPPRALAGASAWHRHCAAHDGRRVPGVAHVASGGGRLVPTVLARGRRVGVGHPPRRRRRVPPVAVGAAAGRRRRVPSAGGGSAAATHAPRRRRGIPLALVRRAAWGGGGIPLARVSDAAGGGGGVPFARVRHAARGGGGVPLGRVDRPPRRRRRVPLGRVYRAAGGGGGVPAAAAGNRVPPRRRRRVPLAARRRRRGDVVPARLGLLRRLVRRRQLPCGLVPPPPLLGLSALCVLLGLLLDLLLELLAFAGVALLRHNVLVRPLRRVGCLVA